MVQDYFSVIIPVIMGTPKWVIGVFLYAIFIGIESMKDKIVYLPKLFIMPIIFISMKYKVFTLGDITLISYYLAIMSVGFCIGYVIGMRSKIEILKDIKSVKIPGNYYTIFIIFSFFAMKYSFGYLEATNSELSLEYYTLDTCISALYSGYFLARSVSFLYRYHKS